MKFKEKQMESLKKTMLAKQAIKPDQRRTFGKYVTIRRTYRKNISCEDFQQIITYAEENGNVVNNLAIMQYVFKGKERNFEIVAHGNKKDKTVPYLPVNLTTREKIKDCVRHQKPTKAMGKLSQQTNMINAESSAAMARDLKQIKNMRSSVKEQEKKEQGIPVHEAKRDKLHSIMIMVAEEESNGEEKLSMVSKLGPSQCVSLVSLISSMTCHDSARVLFNIILWELTRPLILGNSM